jgi:hypothetical protein
MNYQRKYYLKHREKILERRREQSQMKSLSKIGLTLDEYNQILEFQGNVCCLCGRERKQLASGLELFDVDIGKDGFLRGIICPDCFLRVKLFEKNWEITTKTVDYIYELSLDNQDSRGNIKKRKRSY